MNRTPFRLLLIIALVIMALVGSRPAYADDEVVSDCGDSGLDTQLRFKLLLAQERDNANITFACTAPVVLKEGVLPTIHLNVTIDGGNAITLSGNNASRLFDVSGGNLTLKNITVTKGYTDGDGGAIDNYGTLNIIHSKFLDNQTSLNGNGGAIRSFGVLNISNSEFSYNKAASGGALYPTGDAAVTTITGSKFYSNEAYGTAYGWGGAIYMSAGASVTITDSTLSFNHSKGGGGAIYIYQPSSLTQLQINNSTLDGNWTSDAGGGILNDSGTATLTNVTLSVNSGGPFGGGIYNRGTGTATFTNVTLSKNFAAVGGGIFKEGGTVTLKNTVIAIGAWGENCYFEVENPLAGSFNLSDDSSCGFGVGRDGVADLLLGPLAYNGGATLTHMPQPGSPTIDSGTGNGCPPTDQRGAARLGAGSGIACDVGAVEYGAVLPQLYLPFIKR